MEPTIEGTSTAPMKSNYLGNGIALLILLLLFLIFIFFGEKIFSFFHIANIYHFIISLIVFFVLYGATIIISGLFIKYPKDILTIYIDRGKHA